jgi:hypothetical protein
MGVFGQKWYRSACRTTDIGRALHRSAPSASARAAPESWVARAMVRGAERLHLSPSDDASVDAVLEPLAGALGKGT